ncbi:MAG: hypothetical protein A2Y53_05700 [Chloroflexi bacterium RBG_16_47_49]|nr:MAG: hypothetical protein A2Y53_05700 [Chloroflexi bacterium RBG_16_47_49]
MYDFHNNFKLSRAISPVQVSDNTAQVSQIIDMQGYNSLEFAIAAGTLADSNATFTVLVEDGDNSSLTDNAAVADEFLLGTEAAASFVFSDDNVVRKIGYQGNKRYVRMTITPAGNASAADISVVAIQSVARTNPVA